VNDTPADTQGPFNQIRRQDRAQDDTWIKAYLHRATYGSLATVFEGQPFIVARNFVYDEAAHAIYLHGATKGRTYLNVKSHGRVCFSASEMGRLLTAKKAINFGVEYSGVVVFGRAVIVTDPAEARHGLRLLMDKYFPHLKSGQDYEPITESDLKITAVIRVDIESWSGKQKSA
jgi:nitroimidazol reductase NimA-like FMN-containing flavoprotein (pyridoxamine 5'-phosphate oxidase superfamily)